MYVHLCLIFCSNQHIHSNNQHQLRYNFVFNIIYCLIYLSYPFFGLLADVKTGRYSTIITGVHFSFLSWIIDSLAVILMHSTSLEFIIILSPHEMRSLMVGLWYAAYGLGYVIDINGKYRFNCKEDSIC